MTRTKIFIPILALMLCMGAFLFPMTAFAQAAADTTAPTISAKLDGNILHIEAADVDSGVEAVFIDGNRVNYRVDGALDVILKDYAGTGEYVSIYAADFTGNKSKTVQIKNPYYAVPTAAPATPKPTPKPTATAPAASASATTEPTATPEPTSEAVQTPKPFTPDGTGTVVDNATDGDGKEFFTIITPDENEFYLIIDRQRNTDNVYLLNAVTEDDLASLTKNGGKSGESAVTTPVSTPPPVEPTPTPEPTPEPPAKSDNSGTLIFIVLAVAAVGGAGYYFKIVKPKQQPTDSDEFDEDEDELEFEDGDASSEDSDGDFIPADEDFPDDEDYPQDRE